MKASFEGWIGRNAIGVVAAVLVFAGLGYLAAAFIPELTDGAKAFVMFTCSTAIFLAGVVLSARRRNGFASALLGCGAASLYASILATHLYFGFVGDAAALGLVLVWLVGCLAVVRMTRSITLDVVMQVGLAGSILLGYSGDADGARLALLVGYQVVASALVVVGNVMFMRRMYLPSLLLSLVIGVCGGMLVDGAINGISGHAALPIGWATAALLVQFAQASASAVLVIVAMFQRMRLTACGLLGREAVSKASSIKDQASRRNNLMQASESIIGSEPLRCALVCGIAVSLWLGAVASTIMPCVWRIAESALPNGSEEWLVVDVSFGACALCIAVFALVFARAMRSSGMRMSSTPVRTVITVLMVGGALALATRAYLEVLLALFGQGGMLVGWLCGWACLSLVLGWMTRDGLHNRMAHGFALAGMFWSASVMMYRLDFLYAPLLGFLICMVCALAVLAVCTWIAVAIAREDQAAPYATQRRVLCTVLTLAAEGTLFFVPLASSFEYAAPLVCIVAAGILVVLRVALPQGAAWAYRREIFANELFVAAAVAPYMVSAEQGMQAAVLFGLSAAVIVLLFVKRMRRVPILADEVRTSPLHSWNLVQLVLGMAAFSITVLSYVQGCTPLAAEGYLMSVYCMACAWACVRIGFAKNCKALHVIGLIGVLVCVAKLVMLDAQGLDSIARFAAYIAGGVICFAVSAAYNRALHAKSTSARYRS